MKKSTTHGSLIVAILSVVLFSGADWLRFRGSDTSGVSRQTGLPTTWSETENVVWKTPLPGFGGSSPIVLGDKIYLTAYSGYGLDREKPGDQKDLKLHVLCIDRTTGKIVWDKSGKALLPETEYDGGRIDLHGYASGTPVTDGKAVYAFFGRSGVWAYSLDGKPLWEVTVGDGIDRRNWGTGASPILAGDLLIVNASIESKSVVALSKTTGKEVWRAEGVVDSWSTPALVDLTAKKQELVVSMHSKVRGYDPATGKQLWECAAVQDYVVPSVVVDRGIVYVTGGRKPLTVAIRPGGRGDVTESHLLWKLNKCSKIPSPLVHDGLLYWVDQKGTAGCVDAKTGELVYRERLDGLTGSGDKVYASLVSADGKLYAVSCRGGTVVLAIGREFKNLAQNDLGDRSVFNGTPAIGNGQLLLRSDRFLYCIGKE